jgi:hypothetical protein
MPSTKDNTVAEKIPFVCLLIVGLLYFSVWLVISTARATLLLASLALVISNRMFACDFSPVAAILSTDHPNTSPLPAS